MPSVVFLFNIVVLGGVIGTVTSKHTVPTAMMVVNINERYLTYLKQIKKK